MDNEALAALAIVGVGISLLVIGVLGSKHAYKKTRTFYRDGIRAIIENCSDETQSAYVDAGWREYL
jgi:hypothetical protein